MAKEKKHYRYKPNRVRLGLDLMTNTGWAVVRGGDELYGYGCENLGAKSYALRYSSLYQLLDKLVCNDYKGMIDEIVFEHAFVMRGVASEIFATYSTALRVFAYHYNTPLYIASPSEIKLYVTGRGNAKKGEVVDAINNRLGTTFNNSHKVSNNDHNIADAIGVCIAAEKLAMQERLQPSA